MAESWEEAELCKHILGGPCQGVSKLPEAGEHDNGLAGVYISAQIASHYII
jgi:hypothetical protein